VAFALVGLMSISLGGISAPAASRDTIAGRAKVVDGDTIDVAGTRIRLEGIDAPEAEQACQRRWFGRWACGTTATAALSSLLKDTDVACNPTGMDRYNRVLAVCFAGGRDINATMVRHGHAWAFVKYSRRYVGEEAAARAEKLGIWQADTMTAWDYRATQWIAAADAAPSGCAIKGNVSRNGNIYHVPWSPWYAKIKMDDAPGKRWFCSEAEAVAAGWRPASFQH
jgi:endonuclease YncB( thermonuclease family)